MFALPFIGVALQFVVGVYRATPPFFRGMIVAAGVGVFFYEGIGFPVFWPLTMITDGNLIDGRVDRVVERQRAVCEAEKARSAKEAREDDAQRQAERITEMSEQTRAANERALAAQEEVKKYERDNQEEDAAAAAAGGPKIICDLSPRAARGVRPLDLPYPSSLPPGD